MPTPFYHLNVAEDLLRHADLPDFARRFLLRQRGPFLLGNTAPDVQVVSHQQREETHFFTLPLTAGAPLPWEQMLGSYPSLTCPECASEDQIAFIAGYLCHLQADWEWVDKLFVPYFILQQDWGDIWRRLYLHNVLRSYLDRQELASLPAEESLALLHANPHGWLPFVRDNYLYEWRNLLIQQLEPGARSLTVEVFASRQDIDPQEYYALLDSEERLEQELFHYVPRQLVADYRQRLVAQSIDLVGGYLGCLSENRSNSIWVGVTMP